MGYVSYVCEVKFISELSYISDYSDDQYILRLDPSFGQVWKSVKSAKNWIKENTDIYEYCTIVNQIEAIHKFNCWRNSGMIIQTRNKINKSVSKPYNNESKKEVLKWWLEYSKLDDGLVKYEHYKTWPQLNTLYNHIDSINRYYSNNYKCKFISAKMFVKKESNLTSFLKELKLIEDEITLLDERGNKVIKIFDHYLGEGGNFADFTINKDGSYSIKGRWSTYITGGLPEVFEYWKENRYYD